MKFQKNVVNNWNKKFNNLSQLDQLILRSNLLGSDLKVTNFGGGNTSSKIMMKDPITKKNTYIINVEKNKFLIDLKKKILNNFTQYSFKNNNNFLNKKMSDNYKKYGYPFINSNWKPHFTVASISLKKNQNDFIKKFKKIKFTKRKIYLNKIYLYEIKKDQHKLICKLKLK